jgi:hypothetical protein
MKRTLVALATLAAVTGLALTAWSQLPDRSPPAVRPGVSEQRQEPDTPKAAKSAKAIQWFATWESGVAEARRSRRPILLVAAAPHCAGVSGMW